MLRLEQMQDQFQNLEKSFFYEYEDLYEDTEKEQAERRRERAQNNNPFYI